MYNFLDPKLIPKVTSNAPATDNFEAVNLISENEAARTRGYMAYTVIKPPVELEFEFLCSIDVSLIYLHTTVGRQRCTGIEIFAKNSASSSYVSIGKAIYDKPGLTFCNSRKYSKSKPPSCHDLNNELLFFKSDTSGVFSDVNFLKIVIFRTYKSVPCLGSIKVFGIPSKTCSQTTINTIEKIMGNLPNTELCNEKSDDDNIKTDFSIPRDFIDDLTYEIMAIPMTLPCGKTVDRDTLEKHLESEKSFGRKPGDPFTGLKFTETRKPVINIALKSRIDMFLLQNSNNPIVYGVKRTLGSAAENHCKRLKPSNCENKNLCCVCCVEQYLYIIPCKHYYCRDCLLKLKIWKCNVCQTEFSKDKASRYHH